MRANAGAAPGGLWAGALFLLLVAGCGMLRHTEPTPPHPGVAGATPEAGGRFLAIVGPATQHAPPFLGVAHTNFYTLRSWLDRRTGETAHQLYVSDSYEGAERHWDVARDDRGQPLRFIAISRNEITCKDGCAYVEEFAAALPESVMRGHAGDLSVTFSARSGATRTLAVRGDLIEKQLAAIDAARAGSPVFAATPAAGR